MHLISINIGKAQPTNVKSGVTGIFKLPVQGPVTILLLGLPGDAICDTESHGGVDQAVYVFGAPDYVFWSEVAQLATSRPARLARTSPSPIFTLLK